MSNNAAERAMKPRAGRKNYLFCGFDAGGQRAACIYTILESAKMNGVNPQPIWPTSSTASLTIPSAKSTTCFPGAGQSSTREAAADGQKPRPAANTYRGCGSPPLLKEPLIENESRKLKRNAAHCGGDHREAGRAGGKHAPLSGIASIPKGQ